MTGGSLNLDIQLALNEHETLDAVLELATRAEDRGFKFVTVGETTGWNVIPILTTVANRTRTVGVANEVLSPYSRSPALIGQTALTMHDVTNGRYRLGLGTSSPALAEQWHGQDFDRPLRRLREIIDVVRAVYAGGAVDYEGEVFDVGGLRYERGVPADPPAIDVGALGPKTTELAGRFADGWVPTLFTHNGLRNRLKDFERGIGLANRETDDRRVCTVVYCFAHDDPDVAQSLAGNMISFMIGAYGPFYGESVARQGYADVVEDVRTAWEDGRDTDAMSAALPDGLLDSLTAVGTPEDVRETVASFEAIEGVDAVRVAFVTGMDQSDRRRTLDALEPLLASDGA
jgi:coenzyme F420-dependent oxidoreductase